MIGAVWRRRLLHGIGPRSDSGWSIVLVAGGMGQAAEREHACGRRKECSRRGWNAIGLTLWMANRQSGR